MPIRARISVVLPLPLGPTRQVRLEAPNLSDSGPSRKFLKSTVRSVNATPARSRRTFVPAWGKVPVWAWPWAGAGEGGPPRRWRPISAAARQGGQRVPQRTAVGGPRVQREQVEDPDDDQGVHPVHPDAGIDVTGAQGRGGGQAQPARHGRSRQGDQPVQGRPYLRMPDCDDRGPRADVVHLDAADLQDEQVSQLMDKGCGQEDSRDEDRLG